ncbi:hypothetical protein [Quadrisphaera setariae]|uniref:Trypsin n=1 Tax=Quadrisphaera setariae TaxID=2593304 RepID=A0A5C8ZFU4_9ACTN|nr:hypothetical protein [Quadrisphaera setariae]TXR55670.1 hypothetical protein FMM08_12560 [Quadrisphaera setariae]
MDDGDPRVATTAFLPGGYLGTFPTCGRPAVQASRYPHALCAACTGSATCEAHGLPAALGGDSGSPLGGWVPGHVGPDGWDPCTGDGAVVVRGQRCWLSEARFGGTVAQPAG